MSWRESDQTFLKTRAWRLSWLATAILLAAIVVTLIVSAFVEQLGCVVISLFGAAVFGFPTLLVLRIWSKRKAVVETGCVWCLYPTVDSEGRCPECGNVTTAANRDVARHVLKHGAPP